MPTSALRGHRTRLTLITETPTGNVLSGHRKIPHPESVAILARALAQAHTLWPKHSPSKFCPVDWRCCLAATDVSPFFALSSFLVALLLLVVLLPEVVTFDHRFTVISSAFPTFGTSVPSPSDGVALWQLLRQYPDVALPQCRDIAPLRLVSWVSCEVPARVQQVLLFGEVAPVSSNEVLEIGRQQLGVTACGELSWDMIRDALIREVTFGGTTCPTEEVCCLMAAFLQRLPCTTSPSALLGHDPTANGPSAVPLPLRKAAVCIILPCRRTNCRR